MCDIHGDAPSVVADERDLPVGLVRGAVDPRARLAPEAADLVRRWGVRLYTLVRSMSLIFLTTPFR